jgi:predicted phage replisome organizer
MAEVKWIKITTDMFDNRKIKHLRKLPEGNSIVLIWVMLLTMAGRCNSGGMIFLTENIPYTPKMLADELGFEENTVLLALQALEQLNMVVTDQGFFSIAGWDEYQNIEGMEKIREQNRLRKAAQRERQKALPVSRDSHVTVTECHATDIDIDKELDKEKECMGADAPAPKKTTRFIPPTLEEVTAYCKERNNRVDAGRFVDFYSAKGWMVGKNKMKDWKSAVRTWERNTGSYAPPVQKINRDDYDNGDQVPW